MEGLAVITTIQSIYTLLRAIYELQEYVVKYQEDVEDFITFIRTIEKQLQRIESSLNRHGSGQQKILKEVTGKLNQLSIHLKSSKRLVEKLCLVKKCTIFCRMTSAPSKMKKLREKMTDIRIDLVIDLVCEMLFANAHPIPQQLQHSATLPAHHGWHGVTPQRASTLPGHQGVPQLPCDPNVPPCESTTRPEQRLPRFHNVPSSLYPPDYSENDWKAYRNQVNPNGGHPPHT